MVSRGLRRQKPYDEATADGYAFSRQKATKAQLATLRRMTVTFLRHFLARHPLFEGLTNEAIGAAMGLKERQAQGIIRDARERGVHAADRFVREVVDAMASGAIPGPLDLPTTKDCEWLLEFVWDHTCHLNLSSNDLVGFAPQDSNRDELAKHFAAFRIAYRKRDAQAPRITCPRKAESPNEDVLCDGDLPGDDIGIPSLGPCPKGSEEAAPPADRDGSRVGVERSADRDPRGRSWASFGGERSVKKPPPAEPPPPLATVKRVDQAESREPKKPKTWNHKDAIDRHRKGLAPRPPRMPSLASSAVPTAGSR